jgi:hypothetical protein
MDSRDRRAATLIVLIGVLVQLPGLALGVTDGKAINNALRILDGEVPYRDFWTMYAPGHFYLAALLLKVFGVHVWVLGVARLTLVAIDAALLYIVTRRLGLARPAARVVAASLIMMMWSFGPRLSSYEPVLAFLLPAIDRAIVYAQTGRASALLVAGLLCGVGAWFKHDVAFYGAFGIVAGLWITRLLLEDRHPEHWSSPAGVLARIGGGALIGVLPVVLLLGLTAAADAWQDLIVFPATDFRVVRGEAYPPVVPRWDRVSPWFANPYSPLAAYRAIEYLADWVQANVPQVVFVVAVVVLLLKRRTASPPNIAAACMALAMMPLFWASAHVQQNTNFSSMWMLSILLGAIGMTALRQPRSRRWLAGGFVAYTGVFVISTVLGFAEVGYRGTHYVTLPFPSVAGVRVAQQRYQILQPIVSYIRENVPESEAIYAGLVRHDAVVVNNQNFYFMSGRRIASRYNELHPGVVDRENVQREIIADLERLNVRCAVLWDFGWPKPLMDSILAARRQQIPELGSTALDQYFADHFQQVARFGEFVLVWRKGIPMPPPPRPVPPKS